MQNFSALALNYIRKTFPIFIPIKTLNSFTSLKFFLVKKKKLIDPLTVQQFFFHLKKPNVFQAYADFRQKEILRGQFNSKLKKKKDE